MGNQEDDIIEQGEANISVLKNKKKGVQSWLKRIHNEIETLTPSSTNKVYLQVKEERLRSLFCNYENVLFQIMALDPSVEDDGRVEAMYTQTLVKIKQLLASFDPVIIPKETTIVTSEVSIPTKLPQINIEPFSGRYCEYKTFIALFNSLIHNNNRLEQIQKLYYLRSFLRGEASDLIKNLPLVDSSYEDSLKILDKRYNNEFLIKSEHINLLLDTAIITRSTSTNLRSFVSNVKQQLASLRNLNVNVDNCPIILAILIRKLDILCSREFQIMSSHDQKEPTLSNLISFLDERAVALENTSGSGGTQPSGSGGTAKVKYTELRAAGKPPAAMKAVEDPGAIKCLLSAEP